MIVWIKEGDIFELKGVESYAHGCNCAGAMGKGIALQFRKKFPDMYKEYKTLCLDGKFKLGSVFEYYTGSGYVYNLGTQERWGISADMKGIEESLRKMLLMASEKKVESIALPRIGSGLGGRDWSEVRIIIERVAFLYPKTNLFIVENYKNI